MEITQWSNEMSVTKTLPCLHLPVLSVKMAVPHCGVIKRVDPHGHDNPRITQETTMHSSKSDRLTCLSQFGAFDGTHWHRRGGSVKLGAPKVPPLPS
jgi:hypothetical protein